MKREAIRLMLFLRKPPPARCVPSRSSSRRPAPVSQGVSTRLDPVSHGEATALLDPLRAARICFAPSSPARLVPALAKYILRFSHRTLASVVPYLNHVAAGTEGGGDGDARATAVGCGSEAQGSCSRGADAEGSGGADAEGWCGGADAEGPGWSSRVDCAGGEGRRLCRRSGGPSPTAASSSTRTATTSSATPDKAPLLNNGILNLQILQHGETMQHLLEALQILFSLTFLNNLEYLENLLSQKNSRLLFQLGTIYMSQLTVMMRHLGLKRIFWTQEEDMSSWLLNSTDSSVGADRKNDSYWNDVEATYNETTPGYRKRNAKQIKDRFHKVNKWTDLFHCAWLKARMIYTSGYNDQMWIEKAHVFYIKDNEKQNLPPFVLLEVWNMVKTEAKWITYNNGLKAARQRAATKGLGKDNEGEDSSPISVDELDEQPRPMGQKQAKKLKYAQSKEVDHIDLEELDKFAKLQDEQNANRLKILEIQQKLSSEKIEQAKIAHSAAKEQMEAAKVQREARKLEVEARMYETYKCTGL